MYFELILNIFRHLFSSRKPVTQNNDTTTQDIQYIHAGKKALETALNILHTGPWTLEQKFDMGNTVHSKLLAGSEKVFRLTAVLQVSPKVMFDEVFHNIENTLEWNPNITEVRRLKWVDDHTDIIYQQTAPQIGGLVSSRDFVILRRWEFNQGRYIVATVSVEYPEAPQTQHIRGWNRPGCWIIHKIPEKEGCCQVQWLINTNLQGWLPQAIVDSAFTGFMHSYMELLTTHCKAQFRN